MASGSRTLRRRWSETFKKRVVAEASVTVTQIARRYDLDVRRVSNWMKKFGSGVALVSVEVTTDHSGSSTSPTI
jgi:transposase-like protein